MLRLVGPYGEGTGIGLTLLRTGRSEQINEKQLSELLLGYSCYPPVIPKIISCMKASGRYDCRVVHSVYQSGLSMTDFFKDMGISVLFEKNEYTLKTHQRGIKFRDF